MVFVVLVDATIGSAHAKADNTRDRIRMGILIFERLASWWR